jgi:hypothetical protein
VKNAFWAMRTGANSQVPVAAMRGSQNDAQFATVQMEMDDEERQLVQDANAQAGEAAPDAAPPVPQDEDEDIMVRAPCSGTPVSCSSSC